MDTHTHTHTTAALVAAMRSAMERKDYISALETARRVILPFNENVVEAMDACIACLSATLYTGWHEDNAYGVAVTRGSVALLHDRDDLREVVTLTEETLRLVRVEWLGEEP